MANKENLFDQIIKICDAPLCSYGFPCKHQFRDEDGGEHFCAYPKTEGRASGPMTDAMSSMDCPVAVRISMGERPELPKLPIPNYNQKTCPKCNGSGDENEDFCCSKCDGDGWITECPRCGSTATTLLFVYGSDGRLAKGLSCAQCGEILIPATEEEGEEE